MDVSKAAKLHKNALNIMRAIVELIQIIVAKRLELLVANNGLQGHRRGDVATRIRR